MMFQYYLVVKWRYVRVCLQPLVPCNRLWADSQPPISQNFPKGWQNWIDDLMHLTRPSASLLENKSMPKVNMICCAALRFIVSYSIFDKKSGMYAYITFSHWFDKEKKALFFQKYSPLFSTLWLHGWIYIYFFLRCFGCRARTGK